MKKIRIKNLIDTTDENENIDDIYKNICKELNLVREDENKGTKGSRQISSGLKGKSNIPSYNYAKAGSISNKPTKPVKDEDLLLSMTKRLNTVEAQLKDNVKIIKEKDLEISKLKQEIQRLKKEKEESDNSMCKNCVELNKHLDMQNEFITKLYSFLQENGITIKNSTVDLNAKKELDEKLKSLTKELNDLNDKEDQMFKEMEKNNQREEGTSPEEENPKYEQIENHLPKTIDIKILEQRINEMNTILASDSSANFVSEDGRIFKLQQRKEIKIFFYKNGLVIEGYQFFPYESVVAQKILEDIIDGYSPYILKERYPNGIFMKCINKVHLEYESNKERDYNLNIKGVEDNGEFKKMSKEEFVNKVFPEKVIKNGKILNLREDMEKHLNIKKESKEEVDDSKNNFNLFKEDISNVKENELAKIKIKVSQVDKVININAKRNQKVKELFEFVQNYANGILAKTSLVLKIKNIKDYGFVINFPFKLITYDNSENTIEEVGMSPSIFVSFDTISKYQSKETK